MLPSNSARQRRRRRVHWSEINSAMIRGLKKLKFYSEQDGWGFTDEGLYKTHNGGRTWEEVKIEQKRR